LAKNREIRIKREIWNHHYRVVARKANGQMITNKSWHTAHDREDVVRRVFTFEEGSRYHYLVRAKDEYGNPRSLTIDSSRAVNLGNQDSQERKRLFDEILDKYIRVDEKYKELHDMEIVSRTDLDTREKKVYH